MLACGLIILILCFIFLLLFNYSKFKKKYYSSIKEAPKLSNQLKKSGELGAQKLSTLIQIPTVSWTDQKLVDKKQLRLLQKELEKLFPLVHKHLKREILNDFSIIYYWEGQDNREKPNLFLAHYDVVPAEEKGDEKWINPPFSGKIEDGYIWGRGALDIKNQLCMLLQSCEELLQEGFIPKESIYLAFGGDEEVSGRQGAQVTSQYFKEKGISFNFVMDEGGVIVKDQLPFLKGTPAALIGVEEKGFISYKMSSKGVSGHSSMPPKQNAITTLSQGVCKINRSPFKPRLASSVRGMFLTFVPHVSPFLGVVFANLWCFSPLVKKIFLKNKNTASLVQTTRATTVFSAGKQENIIPSEAFSITNHRILPGDTIDSIYKDYQKKLGGLDIKVEDAKNWPANNPICSENYRESLGFKLIKESLKETHPDVIAAPFLVNGSTDSKYYKDLCNQIVRFTPSILTPKEINTIHGINEKVSIENITRGLYFYKTLLKKI